MEDIRNKPVFTIDDAENIVSQHFGIHGTASMLPGERDQNVKIETPTGAYVLKIANPEVDVKFLELENAAIQIATGIDSLESPKLIRSLAGSFIVEILDPNKNLCRARCITFLPGVPLAKFDSHSVPLLQELGRLLARLDQGLSALNNSQAAKRDLSWDLKNSRSIVGATVPEIDDTSKQELLVSFVANFDRVATRIETLRKSVIHNDANDYNVLVQHDELTGLALIGLIDFGDAVYSTKLNDLAICAAYLMLGKQNVVDALCAVAKGYHEI